MTLGLEFSFTVGGKKLYAVSDFVKIITCHNKTIFFIKFQGCFFTKYFKDTDSRILWVQNKKLQAMYVKDVHNAKS